MFSKRIRERRNAAGLNQEQLADKLGVSAKAVSHWETGYREPDLSTIQQLARALNTSISYLVGETDDPSPPPSVAAAHRQGAEPGTPLPPEAQLVIERAIRSAIEELNEIERRKKQQAPKPKPDDK